MSTEKEYVQTTVNPVQSKENPVQSKENPVQSKENPVQSKENPVQSIKKVDKVDKVDRPLTKEEVAAAIKKESVEDKIKVFDYFIRFLSEGYKPNTGEYSIVFQKRKDRAAEDKLIVYADKIRLQVSNKEGSENKFYTTTVNPKKNSFYHNIKLLILILTRNYSKGDRGIIAYDIPISTRSKESTVEAFKKLEIPPQKETIK